MRISQFQRYSQKENTVTNNVLLMLSRLNDLNINYYIAFIEALNDGDVNYSPLPIFTQQRNTGNGIIDGHIEVQPSKILIETKIHSTEFIKKLTKYSIAFQKNSQNQLWHLSSKKFDENKVSEINTLLEKSYDFNIHFLNLSFLDLVDNLEGLCEDNLHDMELKLLTEDFKEYCYASNLISDEDFKLLFAPTGFSYKWNKKHKIYYCPKTWHRQSFKFFGLYNNKSIRSISKIEKVIEADYNADTQELNIYTVNVSEKQKTRLTTALIDLNKSHSGLKYYLFPEDDFYETHFRKTSKGGIQGHRYKDLREFIKEEAFDFENVNLIAKELRHTTWE